MKLVFLIFSLIFMLAGMVLGLMANKFRKPGSPRIMLNALEWFQPWKIIDRYTPKGLRLFYTGHVFFMFGLALLVLTVGLPPLFD